MIATFRLDSRDGAVMDILSLSPHVEVLEPAELRRVVAEGARAALALHTDDARADAIRGSGSPESGAWDPELVERGRGE